VSRVERVERVERVDHVGLVADEEPLPAELDIIEVRDDDFGDVAEQDTHVYTENRRKQHSESEPAATVNDGPRYRRVRGTAA
jgi:hypothetical protein